MKSKDNNHKFTNKFVGKFLINYLSEDNDSFTSQSCFYCNKNFNQQDVNILVKLNNNE